MNDTQDMQIGGRIKRLRRQKKVAQADLAQALGISASYLNLIEHNRRKLTVPLLFAMVAGFLGSLGLAVCVVGGFFTLPLTYCLMACCYDTLFGDGPEVIDLISAQTPPPPPDLRL